MKTKNKKFICENVTVYDPRRVFFIGIAVDKRIISEEAKTLSEAIAEAFELYSKNYFRDGELEIRIMGKDFHNCDFPASILGLRDIEEHGIPLWRWIDEDVNSINEIITLRDVRPLFSVVFSQNGDRLYKVVSTLREAIASAKSAHDTTDDDDDDDSLSIIVDDWEGNLEATIDASPNDLREIENRGYVVVKRWLGDD